MAARRVGVFTSSRADLGPLGPVIASLDARQEAELVVIATGTHPHEAYGGRLGDIRLSDRAVLDVVDAELEASSPSHLGEAFARIAAGTSRAIMANGIDVLVLLGDRWELLAAASAALLHAVPIAHIHGGETTEGAIDERIRHAITKLADLHLCATADSARRIRRLGEEPSRIVVTGAPGLDRVATSPAVSPERLEQIIGGPLVRPFGVVVYHPETVDRSAVAVRARTVFGAAAAALGTALVLYPGVDPGADHVIMELESVVADHAHVRATRNLGDDYIGVLRHADVLVGNSSSGIIEAASLQLPVVDVGERQRGRVRPANVIHVVDDLEAVAAGIATAVAPGFRDALSGMRNPYGDGKASGRIVNAILGAPLDDLLRKPLVEVGASQVAISEMTVAEHASLRKVMEAIDRGRAQIALVIDDEGKLAGTISDGDTRRALLNGATLDDAARSFVTRFPVVARPGDDAARVLSLMDSGGFTQMPVVDESGRLVGLHLMRHIISESLDASLSDE